MQKNLRELNISRNNIILVENIFVLQSLEWLDMSYNNITDLEGLCQALQSLYYLKEASFIGNPVTKVHRYREKIAAATNRLGKKIIYDYVNLKLNVQNTIK